jgi:hypothetical protein
MTHWYLGADAGSKLRVNDGLVGSRVFGVIGGTRCRVFPNASNFVNHPSTKCQLLIGSSKSTHIISTAIITLSITNYGESEEASGWSHRLGMHPAHGPL